MPSWGQYDSWRQGWQNQGWHGRWQDRWSEQGWCWDSSRENRDWTGHLELERAQPAQRQPEGGAEAERPRYYPEDRIAAELFSKIGWLTILCLV